MEILARCVGLSKVSGLLTCWDKICGQLTRVKHLKTGQFLSELSVPLLMHSESQARDRGRKRPRPQETGKVSDSLCYGVLQTLTLAHRNGKRPGVFRQKGDSGGRGFKLEEAE